MMTFDGQKSGRRWEIYQKVISRVKKVEGSMESQCWEWSGPSSGNSGRGKGYPRMTLSGQTVAVHRVMFTLFFGYIPGKKHIDHKCRNRRCVRPSHLEMVTHKENQKRRDKHRRD